MQQKHDIINDLKATLLAVSPMLRSITTSLVKKLGLQFPVLCDTGNITAKSYGLVFKVADSLQPVYKGFGIDLPAANGDNSYQLPLPATYIVSQQGEIIYSFVDVDHTTRLDPEIMVDKLQELC